MTSAVETLTPMMQQYRRIKASLPESILLFRLGDFYEMFFEDAQKASKILNIALTARDAGATGKAPMCGVPFHAADNYISRLIAAGNKVAICDQVEDPKAAKGIVKREVTRIITPGTVLEQNLLGDKTHNYLACVIKTAKTYGIACLDLSVGQFRVIEIASLDDVTAELQKLKPSELLLPQSLATDNAWRARVLPWARQVLLNTFEDWEMDALKATDLLQGHFGVASLDGFGCKAMTAAVIAAGAVLRYVKDNRYERLSHVRGLQTYSHAQCMILDAVSQKNLELVSKENSLFSVLDETVTSMGGRMLKEWILNPLLSVEKINRRQEAIAEFLDKPSQASALRETLKSVADLERLHGRLSCGFGNARDMAALRDSLAQLPVLDRYLQDMRSEALIWIRRNVPDTGALVDILRKAVVEAPPLSLREGGFIREGYDAGLDELRAVSADGHGWLAQLQQREIERSGIKSLKVRYNKVFGYYIEISNANLACVPADYVRKQTMVNGERFITQELKEHESKVLGAQEKSQQLEVELFGKLRDEILKCSEAVMQAAQTLAGLDCLLSLAAVAAANDYVRPEVHEGDGLRIEGGRHPVLETLLDENRFIPNDVLLDNTAQQILLITGPNMAGKSTFIRQVALLTLMAQMGSYLPAAKASIGLVDRIFTRVGASDALAQGQSTFMVEMSETANILNNATPRSLIILDEIGRGTSTFDGLSIAWAVCEYLHETPDKKAKTLFATHYHELTQLEEMFAGIKNYSVAVKEWNDEIVFLHQIVRGGTDKSYGIHVAKLAGLPQPVLSRANEVLRDLNSRDTYRNPNSTEVLLTSKGSSCNSEFGLRYVSLELHPVIEELRAVEPDGMTPMQALQKIQEWKAKA